MKTIHVCKHIDSDTLQLPELKEMIGKTVEILVVEVPPATREEFYYEGAHLPETPQERAAQQEKFRSWRQDPRFERFWKLLDHFLAAEARNTAEEETAANKDPAA